jgi:hypothetical protein
MTVRISKRERIGSERSTLSLKEVLSLYIPSKGLAAAITEQRAFNVATIPALEIEIVCCYIA